LKKKQKEKDLTIIYKILAMDIYFT